MYPRFSVCRRCCRERSLRLRWSTQGCQARGASSVPELEWPKVTRPSPYQIFHLSRQSSSRDIKRRYYELVKIYHPDRLTDPTTDDQDRFRKIVAAYDLLSDSSRRSAFDRNGLGWERSSSAGLHRGSGGAERQYRAWSSMNQEEWEYFYNRHHGTHKSQRESTEGNLRDDLSNNRTAVMVCLFAVLGLMLQSWRYDRSTMHYKKAAFDRQKQAGNDMADTRHLAQNLSAADRRQMFLESRNDNIESVKKFREKALFNQLDTEEKCMNN